MSRSRSPAVQIEDPFAPGVYLTDGISLFNVVDTLPHEPSLRLVEDCITLEILMVHVDGLRAPGVRRVHPLAVQEPPHQPASVSLERKPSASALSSSASSSRSSRR